MFRPTNLGRHRQSQRRATASANLIKKQLKSGRQTPKDSGASSLSVDSSVSNISSGINTHYSNTRITN